MFRTDFRSPFYRIFISDSDGSVKVPLWFQSDASKLKRDYAKFEYDGISLACVTELAVEFQGTNGVYTITANLNPTYTDGLALLNSNLLNQSNILEVQYGYMSGDEGWLSEKLVGTLGLPDVSLGTEISITLKTMAPKLDSASTQQAVKVYNNKSVKEILIEVGARRGLKIEFDTDLEQNVDFNNKITTTQSGESDWWFMKKIAWRVGGSVTFLNSDTIIVNKYPYLPDNEPKRYFRFMPGKYIDAEEGGPFPIFSLATSSEHMYAPGALRVLNTIGVNPKSGKKEEESTKPSDAVTPNVPNDSKDGAGAPTASNPDEGIIDGKQQGSFDYGQPGANVAQVKAAVVAAEKIGLKAVEYEVETVGIPDMIPKESVYIDGIGSRYNGRYVTHNVTHTLGDGGYSTSFTAYLYLPKFEKGHEAIRAAAAKKAEKTGPKVVAEAKAE